MNLKQKVLRKAINRLVENYDGEFADETIENPETGNEIKVSSAMSKSDGHPAKKKAVSKIKKAKEDDDSDENQDDDSDNEESGSAKEELEDAGIDVDSKEVSADANKLDGDVSQEDLETVAAVSEKGDVGNALDDGSREAAQELVKQGIDDPEAMRDMANSFQKAFDGYNEDEYENEDEFAEEVFGDMDATERPDMSRAADNLEDAAEMIEYMKDNGEMEGFKQDVQQEHSSPTSYKQLVKEIYLR